MLSELMHIWFICVAAGYRICKTYQPQEICSRLLSALPLKKTPCKVKGGIFFFAQRINNCGFRTLVL